MGSAALFLVLLALVATDWGLLRSADQAVIDSLNTTVAAAPWTQVVLTAITNLGGSEFAWIALSAAVVWLSIRREWALAAYVALTGLGATVLTSGLKALVARVRPIVEEPVAAAPGLSFPSGHTVGSTVTYGVLVLVFLPAAPPRFRRTVIIAATVIVAAIGVSRVALGVHYPSDVVGGWLLGVWWLTVTAIAFRRWHSGVGPGPPLVEGLAPEERENLQLAPKHDAPLPAGWYTLVNLVVAWVLLWGAVSGLGFLLTSESAVRSVDKSTAQWFAGIRSESLTDVFFAVSRVGATSSIVTVLLATAAVVFALTRRWRPSLFLLAAVVGEAALFLAGSQVVGRARPDVAHLTPTLPPTSSFPSGHVAATTALYGAMALLIVLWSRSALRYLAIGLPVVLVLAVTVSRLYVGVHFLSDAIVSVLYASLWLALCWWALRPGPDSKGAEHDTRTRSAQS